MKYSCHYHLVILLVIATVHYVILCDRVVPHACMLIANLHIVSNDVYINAYMVIIMDNNDLLRLLMIIIGI